MIRRISLSIGILVVAVALAWRIIQLPPSGETHGEAGEAGEAAEHGKTSRKEKDDDDDAGLGRVKLTAKALKTSGVVVEPAGPAKIRKTLELYGKVAANEEKLAKVLARFPGIVKQVRSRLGDKVGKGDVLAVVESNESLKPYEVRTELAGTIIKKEVTVGELVTDQSILFVVADLSTVWIDFSVYRDDFKVIKKGDSILVTPGGEAEKRAGRVSYLSPFGSESTQTMLARVEMENADGELRPGLFVTGEVSTTETDAPVAVRVTAIQTIANKSAVFVQEGDAFEARAVELGEHDREYIEVISGLLPGDKYAAENSFVLKAELGKAAEADED